MRQIGTIDGDASAETFSDYLLSQGMPNMVEESPATGEWSVWVENDDHLDRAKSELAEFIRNPSDPRYRGSERTAKKIRVAEEKKQTRLRKQFVNVRTKWSQPQQWKTPLTFALIMISVVVTLGTKFGANSEATELVKFGSKATMDARFHRLRPDESVLVDNDETNDPIPSLSNNLRARFIYGKLGMGDILRGQVWRLITPIFLHFGLLHIIFNMLWMWDLGRTIERQRGTFVLGLLVLVSAIIPNIAENFWSGPGGGGMSGVVYALLGYAWMWGKFAPQSGVGVRPQTVIYMLGWMVLCMTGRMGPIGNAAHLIGLIVGVTAGYAPFGWKRLRRMVA